MNIFCHHGIKGQKWGVRNGPPYPLTKHYSRNAEKANRVFDSMSTQDKYYVTADKSASRYVTQEEYEKYASTGFSFITQYKDTPVSFFDIWVNSDGSGEVSVGVSTSERGKGYASKSVEKGLKWFNSNKEVKELIWGVNSNNKASIKLAKKYGFKHEKNRDYDNEWHTYVKRK